MHKKIQVKLMLLKQYVILIVCLLGTPVSAVAEWKIVTHTDTDDNTNMQVAYTENNDGYNLEIYRDVSGAIRSRFSTNNVLFRLADKNCPTFQVDSRRALNRSINDAMCISNQQWAEFILGYIIDNEVKSTALHNMMNGNNITYRFLLENGGYGETQFSLFGSKKVLTSIFGNQLTVRTDKGFTIE